MKETTKELLAILRKFRDEPDEIYHDTDYHNLFESLVACIVENKIKDSEDAVCADVIISRAMQRLSKYWSCIEEYEQDSIMDYENYAMVCSGSALKTKLLSLALGAKHDSLDVAMEINESKLNNEVYGEAVQAWQEVKAAYAKYEQAYLKADSHFQS